MATEPMIRTPFTQPFVVDRTKLTRMVTIVTDRLPSSVMEITPLLKNSSHMHFKTLDELFSLENSLANPIRQLRITFKHPEHKAKVAQIIFCTQDGPRSEFALGGIKAGTSLQIAAELQEQFERTFVPNWTSLFKSYWAQILLLALALIIGYLSFTLGEAQLRLAQADLPYQLSTSDREYFTQRASSVTTVDERVALLLEIEVKKLENKSALSPVTTPINLYSRRTILLGLPLLMLFCVFLYMIFYLYPSGLFVWGDYEEYYARLLERRRFCMFGIFAGVLINIIAGALWLGMTASN